MHAMTQMKSFKALTFVLAMTLLMPSLVKFADAFSHHQHEICNGENQTHLHKSDIDCSICKFKLSVPFSVPTIEFEFIPTEYHHQKSNAFYSFLSDYQRLHFLLRGPPQINLV